jgi:uncharacterized protein
MQPRVIFTEHALSLTRRLRAENGLLIFHLSGGCCEGSAPMCFRQSDFRVGARDLLHWASCQLTVDVTEDGGDSFSLEAADGVRFIVRSGLFTDEEVAELDAAGLPPRGPIACPSSGSQTS